MSYRDEPRPLDIHSRDNITFPVWVAVMEHDRCYGGREEGGWWFDTYRRMELHEAWTQEDLDRITKLMCEKHDNTGNYEPGSVLSNGWLELHYCQELPPEYEPAQRPHYE